MSFSRNSPYNTLPDLPPKEDLETVPILKMTIRANKALAELKISAHLIPNQAILIQTLGLSEAKISSEIENIVTTNDELYKAFADSELPIDPATKEVLHYKDALWHGFYALTQKKTPSNNAFIYRTRSNPQKFHSRNSQNTRYQIGQSGRRNSLYPS